MTPGGASVDARSRNGVGGRVPPGRGEGCAAEVGKTRAPGARAVPLPDTAVPLPDTAVPLPDTAVPLPDTAVPLPDTAVPLPGTAVPGFLVAAVLVLLPAAALAQTGPETLKRARDAFEYGDFKATVEILKALPDSGLLASEAERVDAWKMLGLSYFYLNNKTDAANAFFSLLKQNPDYRLDPFYVPPQAVAFFDGVRRESEPLLAPIRERRTRRILEEQAEEEARRQAELMRQRKIAELLEKQAAERQVVLERRVVESSLLVAWLPFGLGQLQNGKRAAGYALMGTQLGLATTSIACWAGIELLREPPESRGAGQFSPSAVGTARTLDTVKWVSAGLFYALWLAGAIEATWHYVPSRVVREGPVTPPRAPTAAGAPATPELLPRPALPPGLRAPELQPTVPLRPAAPPLEPVRGPAPVAPRAEAAPDGASDATSGAAGEAAAPPATP